MLRSEAVSTWAALTASTHPHVECTQTFARNRSHSARGASNSRSPSLDLARMPSSCASKFTALDPALHPVFRSRPTPKGSSPPFKRESDERERDVIRFELMSSRVSQRLDILYRVRRSSSKYLEPSSSPGDHPATLDRNGRLLTKIRSRRLPPNQITE